MKIALYLRVSTNDGRQTVENQRLPLREWAKRLGGEIVCEYVDEASGSRGDRRALNEMLAAAHRRDFDVLLLWSLDRLSREGIARLFEYLDKLKRSGIRAMSLQESWLDTESPTSDLLLAVIAWVASQERSRIRSRIFAGLERARSQGKVFGRPRIAVDMEKAIQLRREGKSLRWIAQSLGVKKATLFRALKSYGAFQNQVENL